MPNILHTSSWPYLGNSPLTYDIQRIGGQYLWFILRARRTGLDVISSDFFGGLPRLT